ncbi:MAG: 7TM-DISM domain-containing protein, partial [Chitinophagaceae bacterium]
MKQAFLIGVLIIISFAPTMAQNNLPPAYEIITDTTGAIRLNNVYWQMLEDPKGELTINDVSQAPIADKFHPNTTKTNGILDVDYSINTFWLRYRFKNSMKHEARITLPKNVTYADLYTPGSNKKWNHKITGTAVPWSKRDDLKRITSVTYLIQPGEELFIYEREQFDYVINTPDFLEINFGFTDKIIQDYYNENDSSILPSFLFGIFLLAALFNLYFFLIVRGQVYLLFSLTLLCNGIFRFLSSNDIFFREQPTLKWNIVHLCSTFYFFFLIHFVRYFFETFKYFRWWDKFLISLSFYFFIYYILTKNDIIPIAYADVLGPGIVLFSILITFILFLRSDIKGVRLAIVAVLPVIFIMCIPSSVVLFKLLNEYTGIPIPAFLKWVWTNNRFPTLEQIGLVWALIFFSWSLFQRYQQLQKQITQETLAKERLAKEKEIERNRL